MTIHTTTMAATLGLGALLLAGPAALHTSAQAPKPSVTIFDGKTLSGWHKPQGVPAEYRGGKWDAAINAFRAALLLHPADKLSEIYIERCEKLKLTPPQGEWDGVWVMEDK